MNRTTSRQYCASPSRLTAGRAARVAVAPRRQHQRATTRRQASGAGPNSGDAASSSSSSSSATTNGNGSASSTSLFFLDKLVEDPVNALLVLGPQALAGAIDSIPKNVDELQAESEQVRDRLTMLAQDPRPWEVKSQLLVQEADKQFEELVEKGSKAIGEKGAMGLGAMAAGGGSSAPTSAAAASTAGGARAAKDPEAAAEEERNYGDLSRKVAEFTNLYLLLREVRSAKASYESAGEADEKMLLGIWEETKASLGHRLDELSEGLEDDVDLPFRELVEEAREAI